MDSGIWAVEIFVTKAFRARKIDNSCEAHLLTKRPVSNRGKMEETELRAFARLYGAISLFCNRADEGPAYGKEGLLP